MTHFYTILGVDTGQSVAYSVEDAQGKTTKTDLVPGFINAGARR